MQQSLFGDEEIKPVVKNDLIISKSRRKPLNKQQVSFNKFIKKIEKLRAELKNTSDDLDKKLTYYGKEIHPLEILLNTKRKEIIRALFPQFKSNKKIKGDQKKSLKAFISTFLLSIFSTGEDTPEQDLQEIYKAVSGESYEDLVKEDFELMKEELQDMFEDSGVEFNTDDLRKDMSPEEIAAKMEELSEKLKEREEKERVNKPEKKKTAKQLEKEKKDRQLVEARNKNIKSIYKQLVKALHPDLEQDESAKLQKEILMKRLTVAYQNNDLHAMLSLEMEWINKEENNIDELSTEKLVIYNQVLKDQIKALEQQKFMLLQHPRFMPIFKYMDFYDPKSNPLKEEKKKLAEMIESMDGSLKKLQGKFALKEIKEIIAEFERSQMQFRLLESDFLSWLDDDVDDDEWEGNF